MELSDRGRLVSFDIRGGVAAFAPPSADDHRWVLDAELAKAMEAAVCGELVTRTELCGVASSCHGLVLALLIGY